MADLASSPQLDELYRLYGVAAHNCSNIEYRIVYLLLGPTWARTERLTPEKVRDAYDELQRLPLGALLKKYKNHFSFTEKQIAIMEDVLEKRNYLIHRFFGDYGKKMHDTAVQAKMIEELKRVIHVVQAVSRSLDPDTWK